jgi:hypothetical protein
VWLKCGAAGKGGSMNATRSAAIFLIKAWQPDADCIAAGDEHAVLAVRCYAAAGLSNTAIAQRIRLFSADADPPNFLCRLVRDAIERYITPARQAAEESERT